MYDLLNGPPLSFRSKGTIPKFTAAQHFLRKFVN
jgi:hypothetical protein